MINSLFFFYKVLSNAINITHRIKWFSNTLTLRLKLTTAIHSYKSQTLTKCYFIKIF